jgi:50S ribosomal protein L16 3-hydroxylase
MNTDEPLQLLGGLSPQTFMRRHWQKKPLLIRQAIPGFKPPLDRAALLDLAAQEEVQSRLVVQARPGGAKSWRFRHGQAAGLDAAGAGGGFAG